jgi:low temperature requirement protein LtrA
MAERAGLFIIIALGESIIVTGATFADLEPFDRHRPCLRQRLYLVGGDVVDLF